MTSAEPWRRSVAALIALAALATAQMLGAPEAVASTASVTLRSGSLSMLGPAGAVALRLRTSSSRGDGRRLTAQLVVDIGDSTGDADGWFLTATSTSFASAALSLPITATTIQSAPRSSCDSHAGGCSPARTSVTYPYSLPASRKAPNATQLFNADPGTGMGDQTFTARWSLAVAASVLTRERRYDSTWTFSLVSGP